MGYFVVGMCGHSERIETLFWRPAALIEVFLCVWRRSTIFLLVVGTMLKYVVLTAKATAAFDFRYIRPGTIPLHTVAGRHDHGALDWEAKTGSE